MTKLKFIFLALFLIEFNSPAFSAEVIRFEFVQKLGEGDVAIYRLDMNMQAGYGTFCFADSAGSDISLDIRNKIYAGASWSQLIDLAKITHSCTTIYSYGFYGPSFYTSKMKYGVLKEEYVFVFRGAFDAREMKGVMYTFRDYPDDGKVIRTSSEFTVNVVGAKINRASVLSR